MSYIILRGCWFHIIVHASTEDKTADMKNMFYEELEHICDKFPKYHMKILLRDFIAKVHEISNDRVLNFPTYKNIIVKSTTFTHRSIHKHTWTSPDGNTHNQTDHILIDKRRH
jgi:hypothetical protein